MEEDLLPGANMHNIGQTRKANANKAIQNVRDFILESFERLDANDDGRLSAVEIQSALLTPGLTAKDAASLNFLLVRMGEINGEDAISKDQLSRYFASLLE